MFYLLEHLNSVHFDSVLSALKGWVSLEPDLYLVSREGHRVFTHQALFSIHSKLMEQLLHTDHSRQASISGRCPSTWEHKFSVKYLYSLTVH